MLSRSNRLSFRNRYKITIKNVFDKVSRNLNDSLLLEYWYYKAKWNKVIDGTDILVWKDLENGHDSYHWISLDGIVRSLCSLVESKSKNRNKDEKKGKSWSIFSFFKIYFLICGCRMIWTIEPLSISRDWSQVMRIEDNVKQRVIYHFSRWWRKRHYEEIGLLYYCEDPSVLLNWNEIKNYRKKIE